MKKIVCWIVVLLSVVFEASTSYASGSSSSAGISTASAVITGATLGGVAGYALSSNNSSPPAKATTLPVRPPRFSYDVATKMYVITRKCDTLELDLHICKDPLKYIGYIVKLPPGEKYRLIKVVVVDTDGYDRVTVYYRGIKEY